MAKKKSTKRRALPESVSGDAPGTRETTLAVLGPRQYAEVVVTESASPDVQLPEFLRKQGATVEWGQSGLTPLVEWQTPGDYLVGELRQIRKGVGPNGSSMYDFNLLLPDGERRIASSWGSTVLDNVMAVNNYAPGDQLIITYLGTQRTSRGLNDAKMFAVGLLKRASGK